MGQGRLIREAGEAFYHCMSRVVDRRYIFDEEEKRYFHRWMRRLEGFCGVEVVTYCLMSNHFHLLVRVPDRAQMPRLTDAALRELLPLIHNPLQCRDIEQELDRAAASSDANWHEQILERYQARRYDLSVFLKELKQRFTQWYNRENDRCGTLWEDRFKSVLVEGSEQALLTMAAYIDLNPVRAGMVDDPKDYRWSGYGEAVVGRQGARRGLSRILKQSSYGVNRRITWTNTAPRYRLLLYDHGEQRDADARTGSKARRGLDRQAIEAELERGGKLSLVEVLRCRVRYFCDGAVFGSVAFVNEVFDENRGRYGPKRASGARKMRGAEWGELRVLRDLKKEVFR